jgi:hypothetical protein
MGTTPEEPKQGVLEELLGSLANRFTKTVDYAMDAATDKNVVSGTLKKMAVPVVAAGQTAGAVVDTATAGASLLTPDKIEEGVGKAVGAVTPEFVGKGAQKYEQFSEENKAFMDPVNSLANILSLGVGKAIGGKVLRTATRSSKLANKLEPIATKALGEKDARTLKNATEAIGEASVNKGMLGITKSGPIKAFFTGKKSAVDLYDKTISAVKANKDRMLSRVDTLLSENPRMEPLSKWALKEKSLGGKTVSTDVIVPAMEDLIRHFDDIGDAKSVQELNEVLGIMRTQGATAELVNNLAKKYGTVFGSKSFKPGPGTSMKDTTKAQAYELRRKQLNRLVTERSGVPEVSTLKKGVSNAITAIDVLEKQREKILSVIAEDVGRGPVKKLVDGVVGYAFGKIANSIKPDGAIIGNVGQYKSALDKTIRYSENLKRREITINYFKKKMEELADSIGMKKGKKGASGKSGAPEEDAIGLE